MRGFHYESYKDWRVVFDRKTGKHKARCFFKAPIYGREKAAYIKLRRLGLSINQISRAFGRSTSVISRILKRAYALNTLRKIDMRKLPRKAKLFYASVRWATLLKLLSQWEDWMCGKREEPP